MDPYVSVIVTAYNRRRYLPDALRSLERQTLGKEKFEVIVVKNFEDPVSDGIIRRNGWRWVYSDERLYGRFILAGAEEARGEVVTLLNDDDMYVPERLRMVEEAFKTMRELAYFHNEQIMVGEDGKPLEGQKDKGISEPDLLIKDASSACRHITSRFANDSSIAVSSWVIHNLRPYLCHIKNEFDLAIVVGVMVIGGNILLSGKKLTMWRSHQDSFFTYILDAFGARKGYWKGTIAKYVNNNAVLASDTLTALEFLGNHPCRPYVERIEIVQRLEASSAPDWALSDRPRSSPLDLFKVARLVRDGIMEVDLKYLATLVLDSLISWTPSVIRDAWWMLRWSLR